MKTSTSNIPASNALTNEELKELKAFFNKLIDARPRFVAQIRQKCIADRRGIIESEHWHLKSLADGAYLELLLNPLPQNRASGSDTSDES